MLEVPVYNPDGKQVDTWKLDEKAFGERVNLSLLKQAIVAYSANQRQGTSATKGRGEVEGSTRKLYAQKHTGRARRGPLRTNLMKGGGVAFGKVPRDFRKQLPKKMRRRALESAILAKLLGQDLLILQGLQMEAPKTKTMVGILRNLKINRTCLLAVKDADPNVYLSSRNIPDLTVRVAAELNAFDVANRQKMVVTPEAMKALIGRED